MSGAGGTIRPLHPAARPLARMVHDLQLLADGGPEALAGLMATGVCARTQDVQPGDVFAGLPGEAAHGASYAEEASRRGAVALLTDVRGAGLAAGSGLPVLIAPDPRRVLGAAAAWVHRTQEHLPLLLGVTGTNGKTTTVHVLEHLLERLGTPAGISSTAERGSAGERAPSRLTTPEADELHALLARMAERGVRAAALEVSAQALIRSRVEGLVFDVAGFTNLTPDHLDDFGTMTGYLKAKARLFEAGVSRRAVLTTDSPEARALAGRLRIPATTLSTTPGARAEWSLRDVALEPTATRFTVDGPEGQRLTTSIGLLGAHQAANAALAIVMVLAAGYAFDHVEQALGDRGLQPRLTGRLERLPGSIDPAVHVDVAHTPDAIARSLDALRALTPGRLVVLFGADGDRDPTKRGPMGRVAAERADVVIVHDHHSRFEDADGIRHAVLAGARGRSARVLEVRDPSEAIRTAIAAAGAGGGVLWAGTGRTAYRDVLGVQRPYSFWDEAAAACREHARQVVPASS